MKRSPSLAARRKGQLALTGTPPELVPGAKTTSAATGPLREDKDGAVDNSHPGRVDLSQPLVDADCVAAMLSVKRKRVYELARRPNDPLPSVRIGGAVRFVLAHVEAWVAAQSSG